MQVSYLQQAITKQDSSYLTEYAALPIETIQGELNELDTKQRIDLIYLIANDFNNINTALIKIVKYILISTKPSEKLKKEFLKAIDEFSRVIRKQTGDVDSIFKLKGRIEYLKWKIENGEFEEKEAEKKI